MALSMTRSTDLVYSTEILQVAVAGAYAGMIALAGTKAVIMNPTLPSNGTGGAKISVPYFNTLGEFAVIGTEGDAVTPTKLTETSETANIQHAALAFEQSIFAQIVQDPRSDAYLEAARQIQIAGARLADSQLITAASASLPAMTKDVYNASAPRTLDYDLMVDGKMLWGDEQSKIALMVVHSKTFLPVSSRSW